jgi:hypothetical protein
MGVKYDPRRYPSPPASHWRTGLTCVSQAQAGMSPSVYRDRATELEMPGLPVHAELS